MGGREEVEAVGEEGSSSNRPWGDTEGDIFELVSGGWCVKESARCACEEIWRLNVERGGLSWFVFYFWRGLEEVFKKV